jgi:Flp pilus assembly protein TadB
MSKTIYFDKLKFNKTDYRFRSKKHRDLYFGQVILDDVYEYRRQFNEYMDEKLNVIYTWQETIKYVAFVALAVSLALLGYGVSLTILIITSGISVLFISGALLLEWYFNRYALSRAITSSLMNMEGFLDEVENLVLEEEYGISLPNI